jgi:hypothetical protein
MRLEAVREPMTACYYYYRSAWCANSARVARSHLLPLSGQLLPSDFLPLVSVMSHHVVPTFRVGFHCFVLVLQVNLLCRLHQIRYKHEVRELSTSQKPVSFRGHSRNICNYLYTNLQVQGCSTKEDITCCKIERDNRGRNRGRKLS